MEYKHKTPFENFVSISYNIFTFNFNKIFTNNYLPTDLNSATHFKIINKKNINSFTIIPAINLNFQDNIPNSKILQTQKIAKGFKYKLFTYIYCKKVNSFIALVFNANKNFDFSQTNFLGLTTSEVEFLHKLHGPNELDVKIDSIFELLKKEFKDPFYIFQIFSVILWLSNDYVKFAIVILIVTIISIFVGVKETRTNLLNIQEMTKMETTKINIIRNEVVFIINF